MEENKIGGLFYIGSHIYYICTSTTFAPI